MELNYFDKNYLRDFLNFGLINEMEYRYNHQVQILIKR